MSLSRMATKKSSNSQKAKPHNRAKASAVRQRPTYADLRQQLADSLEREKAGRKDSLDRDQQLAESAKELQDCKRHLTEALEQQTATSEILGVIASSPTDIQPVLNTVAANAARVCGANDANIWMVVEGLRLRKVATYGSIGGGSTIGFQV